MVRAEEHAVYKAGDLDHAVVADLASGSCVEQHVGIIRKDRLDGASERQQETFDAGTCDELLVTVE